jgi:hypothetical protein
MITRAVKRRYVTADVFTDQIFGGNPLAVVLDTAGNATPTSEADTRHPQSRSAATPRRQRAPRNWIN